MCTSARCRSERNLACRQKETLWEKQALSEAAVDFQATRRFPKSNLVALEKRISDALGLAVSINEAKRGGVLTIRYRSLDQLDDVLRRLEMR